MGAYFICHIWISISGSNTKRKRTKDDHCDELRVGYCIHFTAMFYVNITLWLSHQHVKRRYLELHTELVRGSSYRLHSGRQGGKAIIIQSFWRHAVSKVSLAIYLSRRTSHLFHRFIAIVAASKRHLVCNFHRSPFLTNFMPERMLRHANVAQIITVSPEDSENPFVVYRSCNKSSLLRQLQLLTSLAMEPARSIQPMLANALRLLDLSRSVFLAMKTVLLFIS